jgi:hypothetical protein
LEDATARLGSRKYRSLAQIHSLAGVCRSCGSGD